MRGLHPWDTHLRRDMRGLHPWDTRLRREKEPLRRQLASLCG